MKEVSNNTAGRQTVYWVPKLSQWRAKVMLNGQKRHLGFYDTRAEAQAAYDAALMRGA
jgi:hypothetical protein|tara:strand:- start:129 stop:302 length:174 start_codon:yes stop_codon:yes gene_type:complete